MWGFVIADVTTSSIYDYRMSAHKQYHYGFLPIYLFVCKLVVHLNYEVAQFGLFWILQDFYNAMNSLL